MAFKKAQKKKSKLRAQFVGPSGSGKTWTALELATLLRQHFGGKIAVIDSERGSASKYSDRFEFDVEDLEKFGPEVYVEKIKEAERQGYTVLVIDSMSHEWAGTGGILEKVDNAAASGNKWAGWRVGTPAHTAFIDALLQSKCHVIATARAKTEWVLELNDKGKQVPKAVGMGSVQRDGVEYEFDVVVQLSLEHVGTVSKTRASALDKAVLRNPGPELATALIGWLEGGVEEVEVAHPTPAPASATTPTAPAAATAVAPTEPATATGAVLSAPATATAASSDERPAAGFAKAMRAATSLAALDGAASGIGAAVKAGAVTAEERADLVKLYTALKAKLPAAAPAVQGAAA